MASAFWTLEDGRTLARRWTGMTYMLELITRELKEIPDAEPLYAYLEKFVFREEHGDTPNGFGGFIRGEENIMPNFDLRTFTIENRNYFWRAAEMALNRKIAAANKEYHEIEMLLATLLDMHERTLKGEDPMLLNDLDDIIPEPGEKLGPGW